MRGLCVALLEERAKGKHLQEEVVQYAIIMEYLMANVDCCAWHTI